MARPSLNRSPEERTAVKTAWKEAHNKKRRERYNSDADYRAGVNKAKRSSYRRNAGAELRSTSQNLANIQQFGKSREVVVSGRKRSMHTFTVREMAALLDCNHIVLYRYLREEKFPKPDVLRAAYAPGDVGANVYGLEQARKLGAIMAEHFAEKTYLNASDTETIDRLFAAVE